MFWNSGGNRFEEEEEADDKSRPPSGSGSGSGGGVCMYEGRRAAGNTRSAD